KGWAGKMEDPVEDVFISNVVTNIGNSRVFGGIWEANDFWLQQSLNALRPFRGDHWADHLLVKINGVLAVSEELARRCGLPRFVMGGGSIRENLELPPENELQDRSAHVRFSRSDLSAMSISPDALQDFIHEDTPTAGTESD